MKEYEIEELNNAFFDEQQISARLDVCQLLFERRSNGGGAKSSSGAQDEHLAVPKIFNEDFVDLCYSASSTLDEPRRVAPVLSAWAFGNELAAKPQLDSKASERACDGLVATGKSNSQTGFEETLQKLKEDNDSKSPGTSAPSILNLFESKVKTLLKSNNLEHGPSAAILQELCSGIMRGNMDFADMQRRMLAISLSAHADTGDYKAFCKQLKDFCGIDLSLKYGKLSTGVSIVSEMRIRAETSKGETIEIVIDARKDRSSAILQHPFSSRYPGKEIAPKAALKILSDDLLGKPKK